VANKVALITGITGQDGSYLAELLISKGYVVHGLKRRSSSFNTGRIDHIYEDPHIDGSKLKLYFGDLTDSTNLIRIIADVKPDEIYNLAAQSHVAVSFETPEYTSNADGTGTVRLLEAIRLLGLEQKTKFYQASTSEMFGEVSPGTLLNENSEFRPRSPYAAAKLYSHWMTVNYREAYGIYASNGILFNHESPRRGETFVTRKIVRAAVRIKRQEANNLYLGNLNAVRDWGHAEDYVDGMHKILQYEKPDDWVLATGVAVSVREFTEKVFNFLEIPVFFSGEGVKEIGYSSTGIEIVRIDPKYFRPTEVPYLLGDAAKARSLLNWKPKFTLDSLIADMVESELKSTV
jgi:GDPmannose 4,6-dehydratase